VGEPIFSPGHILPDLNEDQESHVALEQCYREVLPEMSEAQFRKSDYVDQLSTSIQFSRDERNKFKEALAKAGKARHDTAPHLHPAECVRVMRAWLGFFGVRVDNWLWVQAALMGDWIKVPWREALAAAKYLQEGREKRYMPTNHQGLPRITRRGMIPESRAGWVDNWMARPKNDVAILGAYTFAMLENESQKTTSCSSFVGDGCMCYLVCEAQVLPSGISTERRQ
jgi:hypothetical protein